MTGRMGRYSGFLVIVAFIIGYSIWVPKTFLTTSTVQSIIGDQAIVGILTVGVVIALAAGVFDLSFANNLGLSGVICGVLMVNHHMNPVLAIIITLAWGLFVGLVNSLFVVKVGLPAIVVTLGMSSILTAINSQMSDGGQIMIGLPPSFTNLTTPMPLGIPILAIYLLVVALLAWYVLEHSPVGRRIQATGSGAEAARLAGVNTGRMTMFALLASGFLSALAGILVTSQVGAVTPTIGDGYLLSVFAAAFLGTTQVKPGRFNIGGMILALFLLAIGVKGLQLAGGQNWITDAFNGGALIVAVTLAAVSQRGGTKAFLKRLISRPSKTSQPPTPVVGAEATSAAPLPTEEKV